MNSGRQTPPMPGSPASNWFNFFPVTATAEGLFVPVNGNSGRLYSSSGILYYDSKVGFNGITDGTSNTVMMSEGGTEGSMARPPR